MTPVTDTVVQEFLSKLGKARTITSKKMFGGVGIYCDGVFFAVIDDDRHYFKVDDQTLANYEAHNAAQWVIKGPSGGAMPYREVPIAVLEDSAKLGDWIDAAVEVAQRKKTKKK